MSDNITLNLATVGGGKTVAAEDLSGVMFQRVKLALGGSGTDLGDVSNINPLTVQMGGSSVSTFGDLIAQPLTPVVQLDFVYGVNTQTGVTTVANGGTVDTNSSRLRLQTSTDVAGSAIFQSRKTAKYRPGQGMLARFTAVYTAGAANSTQIYGVGTATDGYFFGYNGTTFGICHRNNGSDTWYSQSVDWNGDKCNGAGVSGFNLDPTLGNVFMVQYPYLGYGCITFWILNPSTACWILAHTISYPNTTVTVQLSNPNMFFYAQVLNSGNNTNLVGYCGSVGIFAVGVLSGIGGPRWAYDNNKSSVTAETNLFSLRNCTTYNGVTNRSLIRIHSLTFAGGNYGNNGVSVVRLRIGATVGGTPAFSTISGTSVDDGVTITSGNSVSSVDKAGTTSTGGTLVWAGGVNVISNLHVDLSDENIYVSPGETLTVAGFSTVSAVLNAAVSWTEDI